MVTLLGDLRLSSHIELLKPTLKEKSQDTAEAVPESKNWSLRVMI